MSQKELLLLIEKFRCWQKAIVANIASGVVLSLQGVKASCHWQKLPLKVLTAISRYSLGCYLS